MLSKLHLLFICNANVNRSRTAAALFENSPNYEARSAGVNPLELPLFETKPVTQRLIDWADKIFVMDEEREKQLTYLRTNFNVTGKHIQVLGIPDTYNVLLAKSYEELKKILQDKLQEYLANKL